MFSSVGKRVLLLLSVCLVACVAFAQSSPVVFESEIFLVRPDGSLVPATTADPGDRVQFGILATNSGRTTLPAGRVQIHGPVDAGMSYINNSATSDVRTLLEFSLDGVEFFEDPPMVRDADGALRLAAPGDYQMLRWTLLEPLEPGATVRLEYRVLIDPDERTYSSGPTVDGFQVVSYHYRWEGETLWVIGEVMNVGSVAAGVQLQAIARDRAGRLVDAVTFWPASVSNIRPGMSFGFRHPVTRDGAAYEVEVQIVDTEAW